MKDKIGRYSLSKEIGRGGMGRVFAAYDTVLHRKVALKLLFNQEDIPEHKEYLLREAQNTAKLHHPHIISVYDSGEIDGQFFFTMDLIHGESLAMLMQLQKITWRNGIDIIAKIAGAAHYAHSQGIIHRDIKPSNIMITETGEPKLMDFGLAKEVRGSANLSQTGVVKGTPAYISPEQIQGKVDARSDVYSLGAVMYELLTQQTPFTCDNSIETLLKVLHEPPVAPKLLQPGIPKDLQAICLKALAKEPLLRYPNAREFADDLQRYLNGEPIIAKPVPLTTKVFLWFQRNKLLGSMSLFLLVNLVLLITLTFYFVLYKNEKERVWQQTQVANHNMAALLYEKAQAHLQQRRYNEAAIFTAEAYFRDPTHYYPGLFANYNKVTRLLGFMKASADTVSEVVFSPNGEKIYSGHYDNLIRCWDLATYKLIRHYQGHLAQIRGMDLTKDGKILVSSGYDRLIKIWDVKSGQVIRTLANAHPKRIYTVALSPDDKFIASGDSSGKICIWELATGKLLKTPQIPIHSVMYLRYRPDSMFLVASGSVNDSGILAFIATGNWQSHSVITAPSYSIWGFDFYHHGQYLASADRGGTLQFRDTNSGKLLYSTEDSVHQFCDLAFTRDKKFFAASTKNGFIQLWDTRKRQIVASVLAHKRNIRRTVFNSNGDTFVSVSTGGAIKVWQQPQLHKVAPFAGVAKTVLSMCIDNSGRLLITSEMKGCLKLWKIDSGKLLREIAIPGGKLVPEIAVQPLSNNIGVISGTTFYIVNLQNDAILLAMKQNNIARTAPIAFTAEGRYVLLVFKYGVLKLFSTDSGKLIRTFDKHKIDVYATTISQRHQLIASGGFDKTIKLWDIKSGSNIATLCGHQGSIYSLHNYNNWLASGSMDMTVKLWDISKHCLLKTFAGHLGRVNCVRFSPDGSILASSSEDKTIKLWNIQSGKLVTTLYGHTQSTRNLCFDSDSTILFSSGLDNDIRRWNLSKILASSQDHLNHIKKMTGLQVQGITVIPLSQEQWQQLPER